MAKVVIFSNEIFKKGKIQEKNVTNLVISNLDAVEATFFFNGIKRTIPAFDSIYNVPVAPFEFSSNGHHFDIDIQFTSDNYKLVVDFSTLLLENNNNNNCI